MATHVQAQRITVKFKHPNPLFEKWLTEWRDQAKENDSKMQHIFNNALKALGKYPLTLDSGKDCIILKGFGKKLCDMLDKKLFEYRQRNNSATTTTTYPNKPIIDEEKKKSSSNSVKLAKSPFRPAKGTGAYAILVTLLRKNQGSGASEYMTKTQIIEHARHVCDTSFVKHDRTHVYTVWSAMSTLITKGLVNRKGTKFSLTAEGESVATTLFNASADLPVSNIIVTNDNPSTNSINQGDVPSTREKSEPEHCKPPAVSYVSLEEDNIASQSSSNTESTIFAPSSFDIILLVDTQETAGAVCNPLHDETIRELTKLCVNFEIRHLKVGDFTWICRERNSKQELVLPYIAERKRMDDLGQSIRDGRFHEQKFRLKQCGVQNLMYIVENYGSNARTCLPLASLMQGASNTLIQDQFQVKFTENHRHSMQYLCGMTTILTNIYQNKTLLACTKEDLVKSSVRDDLVSLMTFQEFHRHAAKMKNFKIQDIFVRQLLQLKGVSIEKALAIVGKYATPTLLQMEYGKLGAHGEKLLANVPFGPLKKSIGEVISRTIYQLYTLNDFHNL